MKELFIVYEDYMCRKEIIGIFKNVMMAKYYKENWSEFCHIKKIITDLEVK